MSRSLIEQWFPAPMIGAESLRERASFTALPPLDLRFMFGGLDGPLRPAVQPSLPRSFRPGRSTTTSLTILAPHKFSPGCVSEFPHGEDEYHAWFLRTLGILGDPVHGRKLLRGSE